MEPKVSMALNDLMASQSGSSDPSHEGNGGNEKPKREGSRRIKRLPEKEFHYRQSPLTELLEVPHFRTIHHIFIASLILMMLHAIIIDLAQTRTVDLGLERLLWALGEPQRTWTLIFSLHFSAVCLLYPGFYYWAHLRQRWDDGTRSLYDRMALGAVSAFMTLFTVIPAIILWINPLPFGSAMVATMEQGRLLMKMYAFIRSNVPRALKHGTMALEEEPRGEISRQSNCTRVASRVQSFDSSVKELRLRQIGHKSQDLLHRSDCLATELLRRADVDRFRKQRTVSWLAADDDEETTSPCPSFTKYLYFLFAPTLIYRDQYPRTKKIRWNHVVWNFSQVIGCAFYASFVLGRSLSSNFGNFGLPGHTMTAMELLEAVFSLMLPATLTLMLIFFMVLHTWQNAFAEMLYFGDRLFYRDWWNCSSFAVYYKTWNILVHDWLYTYIFKDATEHGLGDKFKALPTILVFVISSIFHEYILATSFHFFFPALLLLFGGFGFVFMFVGDRKKNSAVGNVLMWVALMSGTGIIVAAYSMEHYARINCPTEVTGSSVLVPRTFACNAVSLY